MSHTRRDMRLAAWKQIYDRWQWWYNLAREYRINTRSMQLRDMIRDEERAYPRWLWPHDDWNTEWKQENRHERHSWKQRLRRLR